MSGGLTETGFVVDGSMVVGVDWSGPRTGSVPCEKSHHIFIFGFLHLQLDSFIDVGISISASSSTSARRAPYGGQGG